MKIETIFLEILKNPEIIHNYRNLSKYYSKKDKIMEEKINNIISKKSNEKTDN